MGYAGSAMDIAPADVLRADSLLLRVWDAMGNPPCSVTGGFVRDRLIGRPTTDLDFALPGDVDTAAEPARRLADAFRVRPHLLGRAPRAVWRVETAELKVELWPLGGLSTGDDILRRDFTCNALVWPLPAGPLIDRVGGLDDLRAGRLAAVSRGNLQDDPVRLLRAARFIAQLEGFALDHRTSALIRELAASLAYAPRERVGQELALLLGSAGAERGVRSLLELGLFRASAPSDAAPDPTWMERHTAAVGRIATAQRHPVPAAAAAARNRALLALLLRGWGCPQEPGVATYAWPRADRTVAHRAASLLDRAIRTVGGDPADRRQLIHEAGEAFPVLLAAAAAIDDAGPERVPAWQRWWGQWSRLGGRLVEPRPLLEADEVATLAGISPGPELGTLLDRLRIAQVRGEVRTAAGARRWIADHPHGHPVES